MIMIKTFLDDRLHCTWEDTGTVSFETWTGNQSTQIKPFKQTIVYV